MIIVGLLIVAVAAMVMVFFQARRNFSEPQARVRAVVEAADTTGFARATGPQPLSFPADFGPHPDYQTEWWYYTGNLDGPDGRHFGYQFTLFRRAAEPPAERQPRASNGVSSKSTWAISRLPTLRASASGPSNDSAAALPVWPVHRRSPIVSGWRIGKLRKSHQV
jgi:predicted secreted hydrolase